jgi:protein-S-isoprenylcysteine O-methyltransferase
MPDSLPSPPTSATEVKEEPPSGFRYLMAEKLPPTPWMPSFSASDKVEEDEAWTSGASLGQKAEDQGRPGWATSKGRRISLQSLQLPAIRHVKDADDLLPIASPLSARPSLDKMYTSGRPKSLEGIALRSFCLGITLTLSVVVVFSTLLFTSSPLWRVPFFFAALSTFHFLEFWTTAKYNTKEAKIESFLLTSNWPMYFIAHCSATVECLFTKLLWPNRSWAPLYTGPILLLIGLILVFVGQFVRATAMVQAGPSFNHIVQEKKKEDHELVTTGIYGVMRHPSYFGFFYWGIGTQLVLGNPICFLAYAFVLWRFFQRRIRVEEQSMEKQKFFGENYAEYRKRVPTMIPFIR